MVFLGDFHLIRPAHEIPQGEILEWLALAHTEAEARKNGTAPDAKFHTEIREKIVQLGAGKIKQRGSHIADPYQQNPHERTIYNFASNLKERAHFFETAINALFEEFYPSGCKPPSHLIHVTCTGYVSPSGAQHIVSLRGFGKTTSITHAYHMGCYAAIPAIRIAEGIAHRKSGTVDLVHTEICSLHMNPFLHEKEQLVVQTLFADGFIKYTLSSKPGIFKLLALEEEILPESGALMSWRLEDWGFRMTLAKELPVIVARALPAFVARLGATKKPLFAIHPGGPKILEQVQKNLQLSDEQIHHSREVLASCGNMSSATLPHIWERIAKDPNVKQGTEIISLAFGPGLTACGTLFEKTGDENA